MDEIEYDYKYEDCDSYPEGYEGNPIFKHIDLIVQYYYDSGFPANFNGHPDYWYPGDPPSVEIISVKDEYGIDYSSNKYLVKDIEYFILSHKKL